MFPIYSVTDLKLFDGLEEEAVAAFLRTLFGAGWTEEKKEEYSVLSHMDREYPPCFVACCKDDATVPYINSVKLYEKLQQLHIPAVLELGEHGGHGFGDGRFCDLQGGSTGRLHLSMGGKNRCFNRQSGLEFHGRK